MHINNVINSDECFFAAANGYSGFRSIFGKIFDSKEYLRVYVLKGGPGTGKSTLMRRILEFGKYCGYYTKAIFCSSDTMSLDGVILKSKRGCIAILDGTAPHERDAIIPGAIDEIINLGDSFDTDELCRMRGRILELVALKSSAYASAYACLEASGGVTELIRSFLSKFIDYSYAEIVLDNYISQFNPIKSQRIDRFYCSSFSKDGHKQIAHRAKNSLQKITVGGDEDLAYFLMNFLCEKLAAQGLVRLICPSPLVESDTELFETSDTIFIIDGNQETKIDSRRLLTIPAMPEDVIELKKIRTQILDMAIKHFKTASDAHFELEKIYSSCVNFKMNEGIIEKLKLKIKTLLD